MKKKIQINSLVLLMTSACFVTSYGQQRPSERSFTSIMNEIQQKQIMRNKMLQQMKQTAPVKAISDNQNAPAASVNTKVGTPTSQQPVQRAETTNTQPTNRKTVSQQPNLTIKPKKE